MVTNRWWFYGWLAAASILAIAVRLPLLDRPLDRDEGLYAYMAQRMRHGDVPYRDVFSDKPPVGFALYRMFFLAFGESVRGAHIGGAAWCALATCLLGFCARRLADDRSAIVAAFLYAVGCADPGVQGVSVNLEILLTPAALAAIWFACHSLTFSRGFLIGTLLAIAGLTKQQAIGHAAFVAVLLARNGLRQGWRPLARALAGTVIGGVAILLFTLGVFALAGALHHFLDGVLWYNLTGYVRREPPARALANFGRAFAELLQTNPLLYGAAAVGLLTTLHPKDRPPVAPLILWWVLNLAAAAIGFRFYRHYFLLTRPALCTLAGIGLVRLVSSSRQHVSPWGILLVLAVVGSPVALNYRYFFTASDEEFVEMLYGPEIFAWSDELAAEMAARSRPDEPVYISGSEPQIYFLARRRCVGRYAFIHPLTTAAPDVQRRVNEAIDALLEHPPPVILVVAVPMSTMLDPRMPPYYEEAFSRVARALYRSELALLRGPYGRYIVRVPEGETLQLTPEQVKVCDALLMVRAIPVR